MDIEKGDLKKVLYVEDEAFFGAIVSQKLHEVGIETIVASDGEKAIEIANQNNLSVILLDILLPGMQGLEVLKKLKENAATKDVPVVILSNLDTTADRDRAIEMGAELFLVKMLTNPTAIVDVVEKIIASKQPKS